MVRKYAFYLDGLPLTTVHAKGRQFCSGWIWIRWSASSDGSDSPEHPTTTDEVDRRRSGAYAAAEIGQYYFATLKLREMRFSRHRKHDSKPR